MPAAMVPMDGPQNAFCTIEHAIRLIEDREPSPRSGDRASARVSRPHLCDPSRIRTLISVPGATATRLVAHDDELLRKPNPRIV